MRTSVITSVANHLSPASYPKSYEDPVIFKYYGNVCKVTLNRPKSLNAVNLQMMRFMQPEINKWNQNTEVKVVIYRGSGDKAFCAGGDIKSLYNAKLEKSRNWVHESFFKEEYTLDFTTAHMRPIQIAFWDGIVMGGGAGISVHAPIRIATETCVFAMPEAKIGLFTDVGAGYFLSRLRKNLGNCLSLTGLRLKGREVVQAGLADFFVKREHLESLEHDIIMHTDMNTTLEDLKGFVHKYSEPVEEFYEHEDFVNEIFDKNTVEEIYAALRKTTSKKEFANYLIELMDLHPPLSLKIIFEQMRRGKHLSLKEDLQMEMRLAMRFVEGHDFFEGIRCTLINKTDKPKWSHARLEDVSKDEVFKYFEQLPDRLELKF